MANSNRHEKESTTGKDTDDLIKKSQELREKHKKTQEAFEKLKKRTEKFLSSDNDIK
ncbi:hypothetical protein [Pedobacter chinensis]|nr:hypothetical protein [Pedobacter chinensis]